MALKANNAKTCCELARAKDRADILQVLGSMLDAVLDAPSGYNLALVVSPSLPRIITIPETGPGTLVPGVAVGEFLIVLALAAELALIKSTAAALDTISIMGEALGTLFNAASDPCEECIRFYALNQQNQRVSGKFKSNRRFGVLHYTDRYKHVKPKR